MTGFASTQGETPLGLINIELRSVNSRFLDVNMRLPDALRAYEPVLQGIVKSRVARGKFDCRIDFLSAPDAPPAVDVRTLENLRRIEDEVRAAMPGVRPLSMADILKYPGVVRPLHVDPAEVEAALAQAMTQAMDAFDSARSREGAALARVLERHCDKISEAVENLVPKIPQIHAQLKARLTERLESALSESLSQGSTLTREEVSDRIRQEVTLYALRMDVAEEVNRLRTHVAEVRRLLSAGGTMGRRLDFLTQEMNRESNTLGSKAASIEMTDTALALKLSVDQMREQIQNTE